MISFGGKGSCLKGSKVSPPLWKLKTQLTQVVCDLFSAVCAVFHKLWVEPDWSLTREMLSSLWLGTNWIFRFLVPPLPVESTEVVTGTLGTEVTSAASEN